VKDRISALNNIGEFPIRTTERDLTEGGSVVEIYIPYQEVQKNKDLY